MQPVTSQVLKTFVLCSLSRGKTVTVGVIFLHLAPKSVYSTCISCPCKWGKVIWGLAMWLKSHRKKTAVCTRSPCWAINRHLLTVCLRHLDHGTRREACQAALTAECFQPTTGRAAGWKMTVESEASNLEPSVIVEYTLGCLLDSPRTNWNWHCFGVPSAGSTAE